MPKGEFQTDVKSLPLGFYNSKEAKKKNTEGEFQSLNWIKTLSQLNIEGKISSVKESIHKTFKNSSD